MRTAMTLDKYNQLLADACAVSVQKDKEMNKKRTALSKALKEWKPVNDRFEKARTAYQIADNIARNASDANYRIWYRRAVFIAKNNLYSPINTLITAISSPAVESYDCWCVTKHKKGFCFYQSDNNTPIDVVKGFIADTKGPDRVLGYFDLVIKAKETK